jgi:hypothetical protein
VWGGHNKQTNFLNDIGRNSLLGNRKKIAKFLMRTFYLPLYLPLCRAPSNCSMAVKNIKKKKSIKELSSPKSKASGTSNFLL